MIKKAEYQTFSKTKKIIESTENEIIPIPDYVSNAYTRYRYNSVDATVEKQCYKCKQWFPVLKLENGKLIDCHIESDYHYMGDKSGYGSYCVKCSSPQVTSIKNKEVMEEYTASLTKENLRYMAIRCAAQGIRKRDFINSLIEDEKLRNPITKYI